MRRPETICAASRLPPTAMTASAPAVVVTAPATSHVAAAMSVTATREDDRAVSAHDQGVSRNARHCGSGIASALPRMHRRRRRSTIDVSFLGFSGSRVIATADVNASASPEFH